MKAKIIYNIRKVKGKIEAVDIRTEFGKGYIEQLTKYKIGVDSSCHDLTNDTFGFCDYEYKDDQWDGFNNILKSTERRQWLNSLTIVECEKLITLAFCLYITFLDK